MEKKHREITVIFEDLGNVYGYLQGLHENALLHINAVLDADTKQAIIEAGKAAAHRGEAFRWLSLE